MSDMVDPRIQLPKSRLFVENNDLIKRSGKGQVIARHGLATIRDVTIVKRFEPNSLVFAAMLLGVAVVAKVYIPLLMLSWVIAILCAMVGIFVLASPFKSQLLIDAREGVAHYDAFETSEEVSGFVLSLLEQVRELQSANPPPFEGHHT